MKYLFNSSGQHIANFVNGQLYAPSGGNIGHYLEDRGIFIDMRGQYMGELVKDNRLMRKISSPYRSLNFGVYANYGDVGNYGSPGNCGSIGYIGGYEDIPPPLLTR